MLQWCVELVSSEGGGQRERGDVCEYPATTGLVFNLTIAACGGESATSLPELEAHFT